MNLYRGTPRSCVRSGCFSCRYRYRYLGCSPPRACVQKTLPRPHTVGLISGPVRRVHFSFFSPTPAYTGVPEYISSAEDVTVLAAGGESIQSIQACVHP